MSQRSLGTTLTLAAGGFLLLVIVITDGASAGIAAALGLGAPPAAAATPTTRPTATATPVPTRPTGGLSATIPADYLRLYVAASASCPGLSWELLAAIGTVETNNGRSTLPGVHSGSNYAGAEGPMQFEPATFDEYDRPVPPGGATPPNPYDPADAIYAAARLLCANGARGGANIPAAIYSYNHAAWYVTEVLDLATAYARG